MAEAIEIIALKQCYVVLGQYAVNQLVFFIMLIMAFVIIIILVIIYTRQRTKFKDKEELYKEKIIKLINEKNGKKKKIKKS